MNNRQWKLYEYLKANAGVWVRQEVIAIALSESYPYTYDFHNSSARSKMTKDIRTINSDPTIQKVIIHSNEGVKIANESEAKCWSDMRIAQAIAKLIRERQKDEKICKDGQQRLVGRSEWQAFADSINIYKAKRMLKGITQCEASTRTGISIEDISAIERGIKTPSEDERVRLLNI